MAEATKYANSIARKENEEALERIRTSGKTAIYVPSPQERAAWKKALAPVHKDMESRIGRDTIQAFYKETDFKPE
jgi:C4-dicarboxylate-binding protein DctP